MGAQSKFHKLIGAVEVVAGGVLDYFGFTTIGNSLIMIGLATWRGVPGMPVPLASAMRVNLASPIAPLQIPYGKTRFGGPLVACDSGDGAGDTDADYKYYAVALGLTLKTGSTSALAVEGLDSNGYWYIENNRIDDACVNHSTGVISGSSGVGNLINYDASTKLLLHKGDQTAVDAWLTAGLSYWTSAYIGHGIAYLVCQIHADPTSEDVQAAFPNGLPQQINVVLKGSKVYDPRLDTTAGGSGSHRKNDPTTWEYTHSGVDIGANVALCTRDYLVRPTSEGGAGIDYTLIPDDFLTAAANACDASMTVPNGSGGTTSIPTYQVGVGLSTADSIPTNIQKLLDAMAGNLVQTAGQFRIIAGIYSAPTTTINEDWLCGGPSLQVQAEQDTRYNTVDATFTDPLANYTEVQTPSFAASGAVTADGGIVIPRHLNLPAVPNQYQAQNICGISANQSREQMQFTLPCNLKARDVDCAEFVNIAIAEWGFTTQKARVMNWQRKGDGSILLTLQQAKTTTYNPPTFIEVAALGAPFTDNFPPTVTNLTAVAKPNGNHLDWDPVAAAMAVGYNVYYSTNGGSTYSLLKAIGLHSQYVHKVTDGKTYYYRVKARNYRGKLSKNYSNIVNQRAWVSQRTQATVTSPASSAATFYPVAAIPAVGGNASGAYHVKVGTQPGTGTAIIAFHGLLHLETNGTCSLTGSWGRISSQFSNVRVQQVTSDGSHVLEFQISGAATDTVYTVDVDPVEGSYNTAALPYAVQDGVHAAGTSLLGSFALSSQKHFIYDTAGAQIEHLKTGQVNIAGLRALSAAALTNLEIAGSGNQIADGRNMPMEQVGNNGFILNGNPGVATWTGTQWRLDASTHTAKYAGATISYTGGTGILAGASNNTQYYQYCDDAGFAGGGVTWHFTTSKTTAMAGGRYQPGSVTTGSGAGTGQSVGGSCPALAAWAGIFAHKRISQIDKCSLLWVRGFPWLLPVKRRVKHVMQPCVTLITERGAPLTLSRSTPFDLRHGGQKQAPHMAGEEVLIQRWVMGVIPWRRWERVSHVVSAGRRQVSYISVDGRSYFAGNERHALMCSHNVSKF